MSRVNYTHSAETREKIRRAITGKTYPYKPRPSMIGRTPWNKGITTRYTKQHNDEARAWVARNPERRRLQGLRSTLKQRFGLSLEDYEQMVLRQNGKCLICSKVPDIRTDSRGRVKNRLDVDHCHKTGKVRGLLCHNCNKGLGQFKESLELLKKAVVYMEYFE